MQYDIDETDKTLDITCTNSEANALYMAPELDRARFRRLLAAATIQAGCKRYLVWTPMGVLMAGQEVR